MARAVNDADLGENTVSAEAQSLLAVLESSGSLPLRVDRPDTPLSIGCLLTGTRLDPSLLSQLRKGILAADRVDILCSFIKWSGVRILEDQLRESTARPRVQLRAITTSYLGATDLKAVEFLQQLPNALLRVSTPLPLASFVFGG